MTHHALIEIIGDPSSLLRAYKRSIEGTDQVKHSLTELQVKAKTSADTQVAAAVRRDQRLREEITAYKEVGAAAKKGSREQIAAANLAAQAEGRLARSIAVTEREQLHLARSSGLANREFGKSVRGAVAGSGVFRGLGRSLTYASGAFLGGYGLLFGLESAVGAAEDLDRQIDRTDATFGRSAREIKSWSRTTAASLGIARDQSLGFADTLGAIFERLGVDEQKAAKISEQLVQRVGDIQRVIPGANAADVVTALTSALTGRAKGLRAYGVVINETMIREEAQRLGLVKGVTSLEKVKLAQNEVRIAQAKLNDARATYAENTTQVQTAVDNLTRKEQALAAARAGEVGQLTAQQKALAVYSLFLDQTTKTHAKSIQEQRKFSSTLRETKAELRDIEAELGNDLIPTLNQWLRRGADWLGQSKNQKRVTRDVKEAVHELSGILSAAVSIGKEFIGVAKGISHALGGWKNTIQLLIAFKLASWLHGLVGPMSEVEAGAGRAGGKVGTLRGRLAGLARIGAIAIGIDLIFKSKGDKGAKGFAERVFGGALVGGATFGPIGAVAGGTAAAVAPTVAKIASDFGGKGGTTTGGGSGPWWGGEGVGWVGPDGKPIHDQRSAWVRYFRSSNRGRPVKGQTPGETRNVTSDAQASRRFYKPPSTKAGRGAAGSQPMSRWEQLQHQLLEAQGTLATGDDVRVLGSIVGFLKKALSSATGLKARKKIVDQITDYQSQLDALTTTDAGGLTVGKRPKKPKKPVFETLPRGLQSDLARAQAGAAGHRLESLRGLLAVEEKVQRFLAGEHATGKNLVKVEKERAAIARQIASTHNQITSILHKQAAAEAKRAQARQFKLLGLTVSGQPNPGVKALKAELGTVSAEIKGTFLDTNEHRQLLTKLRRLLSGQLGKLGLEVRQRIKELLDGLKDDLKEFDGFNLTQREKRRRFLDRQFADRYRRVRAAPTDHGRHGDGKGDKGGEVHYHFEPRMQVFKSEDIDAALRRAFFRQRQAFAA